MKTFDEINKLKADIQDPRGRYPVTGRILEVLDELAHARQALETIVRNSGTGTLRAYVEEMNASGQVAMRALYPGYSHYQAILDMEKVWRESPLLKPKNLMLAEAQFTSQTIGWA